MYENVCILNHTLYKNTKQKINNFIERDLEIFENESNYINNLYEQSKPRIKVKLNISHEAGELYYRYNPLRNTSEMEVPGI